MRELSPGCSGSKGREPSSLCRECVCPPRSSCHARAATLVPWPLLLGESLPTWVWAGAVEASWATPGYLPGSQRLRVHADQFVTVLLGRDQGGQSMRLKPCHPLSRTEEWQLGSASCQLPSWRGWLWSLPCHRGGCRAPVCLVSSACRVVKGRRDGKAVRHCVSCALVTTLLQLNYLTLGWLWCTVYRKQPLIHQVKSCFTGTYLCLLTVAKVSFYLIWCPVCCWTFRALGDSACFDFNEAFSFQLSWAERLFGSDKSSRFLLNARK